MNEGFAMQTNPGGRPATVKGACVQDNERSSAKPMRSSTARVFGNLATVALVVTLMLHGLGVLATPLAYLNSPPFGLEHLTGVPISVTAANAMYPVLQHPILQGGLALLGLLAMILLRRERNHLGKILLTGYLTCAVLVMAADIVSWTVLWRNQQSVFKLQFAAAAEGHLRSGGGVTIFNPDWSTLVEYAARYVAFCCVAAYYCVSTARRRGGRDGVRKGVRPEKVSG